jgi:hypothetical protein
MNKIKFPAAAICAVALLAGCAAPGKHLDVADTIANFGFTELDSDMRAHNLIAVVGFDEGFVGKYVRFARNVMWIQGFQEGTPEHQLRAVELNTRFVNSVLWKGAGEHSWPTGAAVPDHISRLHAFDIVEFRNAGSRHTSDNFLSTGEGNIVLQVLCRAADANYKKCKEALPRPGGKEWPGGSLGTPYAKKAADYGWNFTPAYDASGKLLRAIPEHQAKR